MLPNETGHGLLLETGGSTGAVYERIHSAEDSLPKDP